MRMGFLLLLPFFLIRFGLLSLLDRDAVKRAAYFAPLLDSEKPAYWLYQISNVAIILYPLFLSIKVSLPALFYSGLGLYAVGIALLAVSIVNFAAPSETSFHQNGLYRLSRNPMYISYFLIFLGCALLTQSPLLLCFVLVFQVSAHWIIRSEERWCMERYGEPYRQYLKQVRRYL